LGYWLAGIGQHYFPTRFQSVVPRTFEARLTGGQIGPVTVRSISGVQHSVARTPRTIAEADPNCMLLYLVRRGSCRIEQDNRTCLIGPRDLAIHDSSRPSTFEAQGGFDVAVFGFPKWLLGAHGNALQRRTAVRLAHGLHSPLRPVVACLAGLARTAESATLDRAEADGLTDVLLAMLPLLVHDRCSDPAPTTRSEALLTQMRRHALEHLHDPDLGPEQIARAHYVSTRYVHKLFAASGVGVAAWIRQQRLEGARRELHESTDATIASIASRWGYDDPASFSRVFRQTFGCSPREWRRGV
jgi:AraC-like DNA-binding protein